MEFKIDENLPIEVAQPLIASGHGAKTVHEQHLVGQPDPNVADVCRDEGRVLVTLDLGFADIRAYPPGDYHGLIVLRPRTQSKPAVLSLIRRLIPVLDAERLDGCLWIMDAAGVRIREGESGGSS
jgi:predicted nuclease of predicted toxin-antitoxin system